MRKFNIKLKDVFTENEGFDKILKFVNENKNEISLAIRENEIHLYCKGARFLRLKYGPKTNWKAFIDRKYIIDIKNDYPEDIIYIKREIFNNGTKRSINKDDRDFELNLDYALNNLDKLKKVVQIYDKVKEHNMEKDFKQEFINKLNMNNESNYYAYDIEYRFHSDTIKECSCGQPDLMVINKPDKEENINIYIVEIKYGTKSFSGADYSQLGSGIAGHIKKYEEFIDMANNGNLGIKEHLAEEASFAMKFYNDLLLVNNKNFKDKNIYNNLKVGTIEYIFVLGYTNNNNRLSVEKSFKNYLGINNDETNSKYSVKALLNKKIQTEYSYISKEQMHDFKYIICSVENINADIENFDIIHKESFID